MMPMAPTPSGVARATIVSLFNGSYLIYAKYEILSNIAISEKTGYNQLFDIY